MKISAVIIAFNEEANIGRALDSVSWADETIVVDSHSTDRTRDISAEKGAIVIERDWPGFSAQKQFATDAASNDWVLSLDADEAVSEGLRSEIQALCRSETAYSGFFVPRLTTYLGRPIRHGGWYPDLQMRLFDRRSGRWNDRIVHESFELRAGTTSGRLSGDILHVGPSATSDHERMIRERYAPLAAEQMFREGRSSNSLVAALSAAASFIRGYIVRGGFLDGTRGLWIAYFAARNTFLKHRLLAGKRRDAVAMQE